jgi:hypothetical protein
MFADNSRNDIVPADNQQKKIVPIRIICGMKFSICGKCMECAKIRISRRIRRQNQKYFRWSGRSSDGFFWSSHLKQKADANVPLNDGKNV